MATRARRGSGHTSGAYCRHCGRGRRQHHRTTFSQGSFWFWVILAVAAVWLWAKARGQA